MKNKIYIRTDGNENIGSGHIMRCLTLAAALKKTGAEIIFICNEKSKTISKIIEQNGFDIKFLPESVPMAQPETLLSDADMKKDADETAKLLKDCSWLIADHYGLDAKWEQSLHTRTANIMVIDDLANRKHDSDILLDQNYYKNAGERYKGLVPDNCAMLLGPAYALLREEFADIRPSPARPNVENILVSFGGGDPDNFTGRVLELLSNKKYESVTINIVVGQANPNRQKIEEICAKNSNMNYHCQINYMAKLMGEADLFIGAGGATSWERLALGLPSIVIAIAHNQIELCENLTETGLIKYVGNKESFNNERFITILDDAIKDKNWRKKTFKKGMEMVDKKGAYKVAEKINELTLTLIPLTEEYSETILNWRNSDHVRHFMTNSQIIPKENHNKWLNRILKSDSDLYYICHIGGKPSGIIYLNEINHDQASGKWGFYIGKKNAPKGSGSRMCYAALALFKDKFIKTVYSEVLKDNIKSLKIHERLGFKQTDIKEINRNGENVDMVHFKKEL